MEKAVVLLSGGLDSTTVAAYASKDFELYGMSFNYGQRHLCELECAKTTASIYTKEHKVVDIDLRAFGGSSLTSDLVVGKGRSEDEMSKSIPLTYVPARNTIFLSFALAWCEVLECRDIFIGVNALDYSGYPDCRPDYVEAFGKMATLGTKMGSQGGKITIHAPLVHLNKREIVELGISLGVDYSKTSSCYSPSDRGEACGECDSCILRKKGFKQNHLVDPIKYVGGVSV